MSNDIARNRDVVVTVLGGCVTGIFSDLPNVRAIIIDWDNINDLPRQSLFTENDPSFPLPLGELPSEAALVYKVLTDDTAGL